MIEGSVNELLLDYPCHSDDGTHWYYLRAIRMSGGKPVRVLEASMEESYNSILISEAGPGYPIVYANPAFILMTGYEPEEVIGKSPSILQGPKTTKRSLIG